MQAGLVGNGGLVYRQKFDADVCPLVVSLPVSRFVSMTVHGAAQSLSGHGAVCLYSAHTRSTMVPPVMPDPAGCKLTRDEFRRYCSDVSQAISSFRDMEEGTNCAEVTISLRLGFQIRNRCLNNEFSDARPGARVLAAVPVIFLKRLGTQCR